MNDSMVILDETARRYHARVIASAVLQLEDEYDELPGWEVDELVDTVHMHTAALAGICS